MSSPDDFFVGYLPPPARLRRFTIRAAMAFVGLLLATAAVIGALQRDPGTGQWHTDTTPTFTGVLRESPYPMLETPDRSYLLVQEGKHGASPLTNGYDGKYVTLTGQLIERGALQMIELHTSPTEATTSPDWPLQWPVLDARHTTLRGEIIDPKCYAGAMKPGDGKPHKACATLCIKGGIPPMFRSVADDGTVMLYFLADTDGRPLTGDKLGAILPYVADHVELYGTIEHRGAVLVLRLETGSISRL